MRIEIESENLKALTFYPDSESVLVEFKKIRKNPPGNAKRARYWNVTQQMFNDWLAAPSQGVWFNLNIRNRPAEHPWDYL